MTESEFGGWYRDLVSRVPAIKDFIGRTPDPKYTVEQVWYPVFETLPLDLCQQISQRLTSGDLALPPYSEIPSWYRARCRDLEYQRRMQQPDECTLCFGKGWLLIKVPHRDDIGESVSCICDVGREYRARLLQRKFPIRAFDMRDEPFDEDAKIPEGCDAAAVHENYNEQLAAWNEGAA